MPRAKKEIEVDETPLSEDTVVKSNETVTSEQFTNSKMLDMLALNNELNSLNRGEFTFEVLRKDNYVFDKTDINNDPIPLKNEDGSIMVNDDGVVFEKIKIPYIEVAGKGLSLTLSTKNIDRVVLDSLIVDKVYVGTYSLVLNDKGFISLKFISVVSINDELMSRMNYRDMGA